LSDLLLDAVSAELCASFETTAPQRHVLDPDPHPEQRQDLPMRVSAVRRPGGHVFGIERARGARAPGNGMMCR
jgi:hypothetical protein